MNVSLKYGYIFLSNVKCGSTSITGFLDKSSDHALTVDVPRHTRARYLRPILAERGVDWDNMFVFTSIRNPWDRLVSEWFYAEQTETAKLHAVALSTSSFLEFIRTEEVRVRCRNHSNFTAFACDEGGSPLVDYVLRMEDIDRDLPTILRMLDVPVEHDVDRKNATRPLFSDYRQHYDEVSKDLARMLLREDVMMGGYRF
jgi:hypothetical protein